MPDSPAIGGADGEAGWGARTRLGLRRLFGRELGGRQVPLHLLLELFPFHVVFDSRLVIQQTGRLVQRLTRHPGAGTRLTDFAQILRPMPPHDFQRLTASGQSGVLLQLPDGPRLTGGIVHLGADLAAFLGTPLVDDIIRLESFGLRLGDFSPFDQTAELSVQVHARNLAVQEAQDTYARLRARNQQVRAALTRVEADEARYRHLVDSMPIALLHLDPQQRCEWTNERWQELSGLTQAQSLGDGWLGALQREDWAGVAAWLPRILQTGSRSFECEARLLRDDRRETWVYAHCRYDEAAADGSALLALIEVTERRQLQRELLEADRLEILNRMTANLAQSFNSVLFNILGQVERLVRSPGSVAPAADAIRAAIDSGRDITREMMAVARQQPLQPRDVELDAYLDSLRTDLQHAAGPDCRLEHRLGNALATAYADPEGLAHALVALVGFLGRRPATTPRIALTATLTRVTAGSGLPVAPGRYAIVSLSAPEAALDEQAMRRAFEPYATSGPGPRHEGLGLAAAQGYARQSGGMATIESDRDSGITLNLYLPEGRSRAAPRAGAGERSVPRGAGRILVVDDEPSVLALVETWLGELGYEVVTATSGEIAMQRLGESRCDLLITDLMMPGGMHGLELLDAARALHANLPIIISTGFAERGMVLRQAACHVLVKPYTMEQLGGALRSLLPSQAAADNGR